MYIFFLFKNMNPSQKLAELLNSVSKILSHHYSMTKVIFYAILLLFLLGLLNLCLTYNIFIQTMKKVIPSDLLQMSMSNISTNDVIHPALEAECRFCKKTKNPQNSHNQFLSPCSCLQPIHSYCLSDEMGKSTRREASSGKSQRHYTCHKCQGNIRFHFQSTHQCRNSQGMRQFARQRKCFCFWLIFSIFLMISLLVFVIVMKATGTKIDCATTTNTTIIGVVILVIVLFLIITFFCLTQVVYEQKRKVSLVTAKIQQRRKHSSRLQIIDYA